MKIAFYAPLKPYDDPTPSGDREIARNLYSALVELNHEVFVASRLRSWRQNPDSIEFDRIKDKANLEVERLLTEFDEEKSIPDIWFTYHNYYKAPDFLGPIISDTLGIPYIIVEASRAAKRQYDEWSAGLEISDQALNRADLVISLKKVDELGISELVPKNKRALLSPFFDTSKFDRSPNDIKENTPLQILTVAMMRQGDKFHSYQILAEVLSQIEDLPWELIVIGDGPMRQQVESLFNSKRCTFVGPIESDKIGTYFVQSDIFIWPAINEAFGMVFLEAQIASLAVIAGRSLGVPEFIEDGVSGILVSPEDINGFADALRNIILDTELRTKLKTAAHRNAVAKHGFKCGVKNLGQLLKTAQENYKSRVISNLDG